jgi:hypothetical protein
VAATFRILVSHIGYAGDRQAGFGRALVRFTCFSLSALAIATTVLVLLIAHIGAQSLFVEAPSPGTFGGAGSTPNGCQKKHPNPVT